MKTKTTFLFLISILSVLISSDTQSQTSVYPFLFDGDLKWDLADVGPGTFTDNPQYATIGIDGTVYVNTEQAYLVALDQADGSELWNVSGHYFPPSITPDGTIISGSASDLVAINPDGSEKWRVSLESNISATPALSANGIVYLCAENYLIAVDPVTQAEIWRFATGNELKNAPSVGHDGTVYVCSGNDLIAINPVTHSEVWRFSADDPITTSAAIGDRGMIYIGANSKLYSINPGGLEEWKYSSGAYIGAAPAIGSDGTLYTPVCFLSSGYSGYGFLMAMHPDGYQKWRFNTDYYNYATPTLGADGTIYLASAGYEGLLAIDPYGNKKWNHPAFGNARWSPPMAPDGTIYFSSSLGAFTALQTTSGGLAGSPWPMDGHDAQHSGRNDAFTPSCAGPIITTEPENQLVESGSAAILSITASGNEPLNYQWYEGFLGDKTNPVGTNASFTTPALTESKQYWIEITNNCGSTFSRNVTVAVGGDGQMKWFFMANEAIQSSPAIADDGTIYFGTTYATLFAVGPDGYENWQFQAYYTPTIGIVGSVENWIAGSNPTVGPDGTIYVGTGALYDPAGEIDQVVVGLLWALNPDGSEKWKYITDGSEESWPAFFTSPALGLDGTIYITSDQATLYAIKGDGTKKWIFEPPVEYWSSRSNPSIGIDGTIYYCVHRYDGPTYIFSQRLYAINPDGTQKWEYQTENANGYYASPAIGQDGTLYLPGPHEHFLAINPDGTEKWRFHTGALCGNASLGADGTVYFSSGQDLGNVYALNPIDGQQIWKSESLYGESVLHTSPSVGVDGIIYIRMGDRLYALNPSDGSEKWNYSAGTTLFSSPALSQDGTIYVGTGEGSSSNGFLMAITTTSLGMADSHWPTFGQNSAHWQRDPDATINCEAPAIITQPQNQSITIGEQATLSVTATGTAPLYQWYEGETGDMGVPADTGNIMITPTLSQNKNYWVHISNACGEVSSITAMVTVDEFSTPEDEFDNELFNIFPNPCRNNIQITYSKLQNNSTLNTQHSTLEILDLHGRVIYAKKIASGDDGMITVDVSHLPTGLYLVKLQTKEAVGVRKFIKK